MPGEPRIVPRERGRIREFFTWYERRFGADHVRAMAARVAEDLRALLLPTSRS